MSKAPILGLHVSIEQSLDLAFDRAKEIGCTTFQIFTRNPRRWQFSPLADDQVATFHEKRRRSGYKSIVAHMPYLPNLATSEPGLLKASRHSLDEEVHRCDDLGIEYLVTHLGSHMGGGTMLGVRNISGAVNEALAASDGETTILLENMAGQHNSVGGRFEDLMLILDRVKRSDRVGVCFDTCMPPGSLVLRDGIPGRIQNVMPGDSVSDGTGIPSLVTRVLRRPYAGGLVAVKPSGLPWIQVTPEHPMMYVKVNRVKHLEESPWRVKIVEPPAWVQAGEIKQGNYLVMPKPRERGGITVDFRPYFGSGARRPFSLQVPFSNGLAELFGLYLAEGYTFLGEGLGVRGADNGKVYLSFGKHEKKLIERAIHLFEILFGLRPWVDEAETSTKVCVGSNVLSRFFRHNFGSNAREKRVPSFILFSEESTIRAFLLAFLAGDGCVDNSGVRFVTASEIVSYQLILLLARLDIRATITPHKPTTGKIDGRPIHGNGWFTVHVGRADSLRLGFEYKLPTIPQRTILRTSDSFLIPIDAIQRQYYNGDVYNLTTETGSFMSPLVATHNCHAFAAGFDLTGSEAVRRTLMLFDDAVGYDRLKVVHLNDSKGTIGSNLDRHEYVGRGKIGRKGMKALLHYKGMMARPLIMETPFEDLKGMRQSLSVVRTLAR